MTATDDYFAKQRFAIETSLLHDFPARGHGTTLRAGDVIRIFDGAFSDAVILGFNVDGDAKVSRPYAYAGNVGTTGPTTLLGAETLSLTPNNLRTMLEKFGRKDDPRGVQSDKRTT